MNQSFMEVFVFGAAILGVLALCAISWKAGAPAMKVLSVQELEEIWRRS